MVGELHRRPDSFGTLSRRTVHSPFSAGALYKLTHVCHQHRRQRREHLDSELASQAVLWSGEVMDCLGAHTAAGQLKHAGPFRAE